MSYRKHKSCIKALITIINNIASLNDDDVIIIGIQ